MNKVSVSIYLDKDVYDKLSVKSKKEERSLN